jgi:hypothetical protein
MNFEAELSSPSGQLAEQMPKRRGQVRCLSDGGLAFHSAVSSSPISEMAQASTQRSINLSTLPKRWGQVRCSQWPLACLLEVLPTGCQGETGSISRHLTCPLISGEGGREDFRSVKGQGFQTRDRSNIGFQGLRPRERPNFGESYWTSIGHSNFRVGPLAEPD